MDISYRLMLISYHVIFIFIIFMDISYNLMVIFLIFLWMLMDISYHLSEFSLKLWSNDQFLRCWYIYIKASHMKM